MVVSIHGVRRRQSATLALRLDGSVVLNTTFILGRNFSRVVLECDFPVMDWGQQMWWLVTFDVNEVEAYSALALPTGLLTVLAYWYTFVALQMAFSTCETSRADPLRLPSTTRRYTGHRRIYVALVRAVPYRGWCRSLRTMLGHPR